MYKNKSIKAVIFADTHNSLEEKEINTLLHKPHDLIILLGDIGNHDWEFLLDNEIFCADNKIAVAGNHDDGEFNWRINQRIKEKYGPEFQIKFFDSYRAKDNKEILPVPQFAINGITFTGISGSAKYKNIDSPYLKTQKQALNNLRELVDADIIISHDKPKTEYDDSDMIQGAHYGLYAIWYYMQQHKAVNIHGHMHSEYVDHNRQEFCFFKTAYIKIAKRRPTRKIKIKRLKI